MSAYTVPTKRRNRTAHSHGTKPHSCLCASRPAARSGLGYSFADIATAHLIEAHLKHTVVGRNPLNISELWSAMVRSIRNLGRPGISSMAISAVDNALWDLKARLLNLSVADLLGRAQQSIPAYGSGGFTSYSNAEFERQLAGWVNDGITRSK